MTMAVFGLLIGLITIVDMGYAMLTYYSVDPLAVAALTLGALGAGMCLCQVVEWLLTKGRKP